MSVQVYVIMLQEDVFPLHIYSSSRLFSAQFESISVFVELKMKEVIQR